MFTLNFCQQKSIRSDLKSMSIEEMQKLKEEIGLKLFNKAVRGGGGDGGERHEKRRKHFPRDNKVSVLQLTVYNFYNETIRNSEKCHCKQ